MQTTFIPIRKMARSNEKMLPTIREWVVVIAIPQPANTSKYFQPPLPSKYNSKPPRGYIRTCSYLETLTYVQLPWNPDKCLVSVRILTSWNSHTLLVGMKTSPTTMRKYWALSTKTEHVYTAAPSNFKPAPKYMYKNISVTSSIIKKAPNQAQQKCSV